MSNLYIANLGVDNLAPGTGTGGAHTYEERTKLFMKKFSGVVYGVWKKKCLFNKLCRTHTITNGKSASFNYTGRTSGYYHVKGTPILGSNNPPISEQIVNLDDLLVAPVSIYDLEQAMLHFDVGKEYAEQIGEAISVTKDELCARVAVLAARHGALNADHDGGTVLKNKDAATDAQTLADMVYYAAQVMDEKDVPESDRHLLLPPAQYYKLLKVKDLIDRDYGGAGSYQKAQLNLIADMTIHKTNRLPNGKKITTRLDGEHNDYTGDFTDTVALVLNKQAIGVVQMKGLKIQKTGHDFNVVYQSNMMVASMDFGVGILRPECAVEISKATA